MTDPKRGSGLSTFTGAACDGETSRVPSFGQKISPAPNSDLQTGQILLSTKPRSEKGGKVTGAYGLARTRGRYHRVATGVNETVEREISNSPGI
ncbi:MAG: hypothetical protein OHK0013_04360 [Sandaracinaceae bacterium]